MSVLFLGMLIKTDIFQKKANCLVNCKISVCIYSNLTGFRNPVRFQPVSHTDSLEAKSEKQNAISI